MDLYSGFTNEIGGTPFFNKQKKRPKGLHERIDMVDKRQS
jgi:hypothetical protein